MATATLAGVLHQLRTIASVRAYEERSDGELLTLFLAQREEAAFVALVKRHGPMVLQVCRRIQGNEQDAEDVFQATFLLLARKAGSISKPESLASWLHGVAHRLALEAKAQGTRRQGYERRAADMRSTSDDSDDTWHDLQETLDEALRQLPEKYRLPLLLCYLEGKTQEEAARRLGCPLGTVRSRLARGRERLKEVLKRQGVSLSAAALSAGLARSTASAAVPPLLVHATTRAALAYAGGKTAAALVSARTASLVEAGLKAMLTAKIEIATVVLLAVGTLGLGAGATVTRVLAGLPQQKDSASLMAKKEVPPAIAKPSTPPPTDATKPASSPNVPADPTAGEPAILYGRVLDPDSKPVPSAQVSYQQERWLHSAPGFYYDPVSGGADGDGRFRLSVTIHGRTPVRPFNPIGTLTAVASGYAPAAIHVGAPEHLKEFTLRLVKDDVPIEGRLIDLQGKPVAGITVRLLNIRTTLPADLQPWLDAIRDNRELPHQAYLGISFTASQAGLNRTAVTEADGRFRLSGAGRERIVALRLDGPTIESEYLFVMTRLGKTFRIGNARYWHPSWGPDLIHGARFEHAVAPATPVEGIVQDLDTGKPIAGVTVRCRIETPYEWTPEYITATTDAAGRYRLIGHPRQSPYWILASPPAGQPYLPVIKLPTEAAAGQPAKLEFALKRGLIISGRVTDKVSGKPIRAEVSYFPLAGNPFLRGVEKYPKSATMSSKKDGSFCLVGLPGPGLVTVELNQADSGRYLHGPGAEHIKGYDTKLQGFACPGENVFARKYSGLAGIETKAQDKVVTCDFQLVAGKTITGISTGPDGQQLNGVDIHGKDMTDIRDLPTAHFTLHNVNPARPSQFLFRHRAKNLVAAVVIKGDEPDGFTVRLQPAATVSGRLIDEDNLPLAGRSIAGEILPGQLNLTQAWGILFSGTSDKDGRFRVEGIVPGIKVDAHILRTRKPLNNSVFGDLVFDPLTLKPGENRDLGDIRVNDPN
jgi:RNA polymerase sigma factor (sigma-70 family)